MVLEDYCGFDKETRRYGYALLRYANVLINKDDNASAQDLQKAEELVKEAESVGCECDKRIWGLMFASAYADLDYMTKYVEWFKISVNNTEDPADLIDYSLIGILELFGSGGVAIDYEDGFAWAMRSYNDWQTGRVECGMEFELLMAIGMCYLAGAGTEKDIELGKRFWSDAFQIAEEDNSVQVVQLAHVCGMGNCKLNTLDIEMDPDPQLEYEAYSIAAGLGNEEAIEWMQSH